MIKLRKNGVDIEITKNKDGIIIQVKSNKVSFTFCIVLPGNIFILEQGKWVPVETSSDPSGKTVSKYYFKPERIYRDPVDKASVELREIVTSQFNLSFLNYEKFFIEKVIYEFFNNLDLFNWFPGYGEAVLVELLPNRMRAHYKDGSTEGFNMTEASKSVILPFDDYKITLPSLPPITSNNTKPSPSINKITLPPMTPMSLKSQEVKLIVSNDLSIPINVNEEGIETPSSLPDLEEDFADISTQELSDTDEE